MCINLDKNRSLTIGILLITIQFLGIHILISFFMSEMFLLRFKSVMFDILSRLSSNLKDVNVLVQLCLNLCLSKALLVLPSPSIFIMIILNIKPHSCKSF